MQRLSARSVASPFRLASAGTRAFSAGGVGGGRTPGAFPTDVNQYGAAAEDPSHPHSSSRITGTAADRASASASSAFGGGSGAAAAAAAAGVSDKPLADNDPAAHWDEVKRAAQESAMRKERDRHENEAAPPIINVPALCSRVVGRGNDIYKLWQKLHQGRRVLVLRGVDGIGKSSLAVAFGEHARSSGRFTYVQWIDGRVPVIGQLQALAREVGQRKEVKVLLIFDDVAHPEEILTLLPPNDAFCAVITTTNRSAFATQVGVRGNGDEHLAAGGGEGEQSTMTEGGTTASFAASVVYVHDVDPPLPQDAADLIVEATLGGSSASAISIGPSSDALGKERELKADEPAAAAFAEQPQTAKKEPAMTMAVPEGLRSRMGGAATAAPEEVLRELSGELALRLGCAPILCHLAGCYLHQAETVTPGELLELLDSRAPLTEDGGMSLSATLATLVELSMERVAADVGETAVSAQDMLMRMSLLNTEDLTPGVCDSLFGEDGMRVLRSAIAHGLASSQWTSDAIALQGLVAKFLRERLFQWAHDEVFQEAVTFTTAKLFALWPRRWRGMGADRAWSLAMHTAALHDAIVPPAISHAGPSRGAAQMSEADPEPATPRVPLSVEMLAAFDRAAVYMAHISGKDTARAATLWATIAQEYKRQGIANAESARVALDLTKVYYRSGDFRTKAAAKSAFELAKKAHGARSVDAAVAYVYCVRALPYDEETLELLTNMGDVIEAALSGTSASSADDVMPQERIAMLRESLFVLRTGAAKTTEALRGTVPDEQWKKLAALGNQLRETEAAKRAVEMREREKLKKGGNAFDLERE